MYLGQLENYEVEIHVDKTVPTVAAPTKPQPFHLRQKLDKEIERMEKDGIIEDHHGPAPWVSNLVLAPKDDGGIRVTVDMREPNKAIKDTRIPIPRAEDIRAELAGCKWFTKLDFKTAYHQLRLSPKSRYLTVFSHNNKLKRHTRLTMGCKPAAGELNKALRPLFSDIPEVHIIHDDVIIATVTEDEHDKVIRKVMEVIVKSGLTLNYDKCMFKKQDIPFWGMRITSEGVIPDPKKVEALKKATRPRNKAEVMSFLCMLQSNSEFMPQLSQHTSNLRELTKKTSNFKWTNECNTEFKKLKELLYEDSLLRYFNPDLRTFIFVDAHKTGLSAILAQGTTAEDSQIVTCASRATTPIERQYPHLDLEALSIDFALRRFRQYVVGSPEVQIMTDHRPLVSIFKSTRRGSVRTDRIKLRHQDVNYKVIYQKGSKNSADYMSRHAMELNEMPREWRKESSELEKTVWFLNFSPYTEAIAFSKIIKETKKDKVLQSLTAHIMKGFIPKNVKEMDPYRNVFDSLMISDTGLILKEEKIVLPKILWKVAADKAHQGGHPGMTRMKTRIRSHFWIPNLNNLVEKTVQTCQCQLFSPKTTKEPIAPQKTPKHAWEEVNIDLFGPLPDKKHVLVVQDGMSRFPTAKIVSSTQATPVIKALNEVYTAYGNPEVS